HLARFVEVGGTNCRWIALGRQGKVLPKRDLLKVVHKRNLDLDEVGKRILRFFHRGKNKKRDKCHGAEAAKYQRVNFFVGKDGIECSKQKQTNPDGKHDDVHPPDRLEG